MEKELTLQRLASKISKLEGKKHQASVGDIREVLRILCGLIAEELAAGHPDGASLVEQCIWEESRARMEKLLKKKKK